jgi:alpha-1,3-glucan synthase
LEILQSASIKIHKKRMEFVTERQMGLASGTSSGWATPNLPGWMTPRSGAATPNGFGTPRGGGTPAGSRPGTRPSSPTRSGGASPNMSRNGSLSLGMHHGPGHIRPHHGSPEDGSGRTLGSIEDEEEYITSDSADAAKRQSRHVALNNHGEFNFELRDGTANYAPSHPEPSYNNNGYNYSPAGTPGTMTPIEGAGRPFLQHPNPSFLGSGARGDQTPLSTQTVVDEKSDKAPQILTPFFTDPTGLYFKTFERMLDGLSGKTSESQLCIEQYLEKSEKTWFNRLHTAKMTKNLDTPGASRVATPAGSIYEGIDGDEPMSQFLLPENYQPPTGLKKLLSTNIGDWPIYSFLLALGQILAANSYQITLLTGQQGQTASELYVIASIYLASSLIWWYMFRRLPLKFVMCFPWFFYGLGFFLLAFAPYASSTSGRGWVQNVATGSYAIASAAGSFMFSQNFGSTGSAPVKEWAFRACAIQGTQQLYVIALWFWGTDLTRSAALGKSTNYSARMTGIGIPISILMWVIGFVLWTGLPDFYRQKPGGLPSFYTAALRRKIILWFFFAVFVQNFFLSAPYGRNWAYLWNSQHAPGWAIFLLILLFFVVVWAGALVYFSHLSMTHSWILPMFAVALIAPRWCQIWWATSNIGSYLPWAGGPVASAILGRALWLWLGVLDSLQGVGIGMLLLQTLTRFHITFALVGAQVIGSIGTIIARADGLSSTGPLPYFPSLATNIGEGLSYAGFWICLFFQVIICVGYFAFFRKEQLSKP